MKPLALLCALLTGLAPIQSARANNPRLLDGEDGLRLLQARCTRCHGGVRTKSGVHFHRAESLFRPADSGAIPIVAGQPESSELWRRITAEDPDERMPPNGALTATERGVIRQWIKNGAPTDASWSAQPLREPPFSASQSDPWAQTRLDQIARATWKAAGRNPSPPASPGSLIRRVSLDLTGLPPDPALAKAFTQNPSDAHYRAIVDNLLESPHFGERWARHWLDQARYADSDGYEKDRPRPHAWRYRDWVIDAINEDLPLDAFARYQIAGDLLEDRSKWVATGFHRQTLHNTEGGVDPEEDRVKRTMDRANTVASIWLGRTLECAQCHNHPYDPITQEDYYRFYAFFNNLDEPQPALWRRPSDADAYQRLEAAYRSAQASARERLQQWVNQWRDSAQAPDESALPNTLWDRLKDPTTPGIPEAVAKHFFESVDAETKNAYEAMTRWAAEHRTPTMVVSERDHDRRTTYLFTRGDFLNPDMDRGLMTPSWPLAFAAEGAAQGELDRLDLVDWLFGPAAPLTARNLANTIWGRLFGQGIAEPVDDLGVRAPEPPASPILDGLAATLIDLGWSRKALLREIVLSSVYRQATGMGKEALGADSDAAYFTAQHRIRLEAESIRDVFLHAAGLLHEHVGGPSVFPPLDPDVAQQSYANNFSWRTSTAEDRYRRGLYTFFKRTAPHPDLTTFDCPDSTRSVANRNTSNTALQALALMGSETFHEAAVALGYQLATTTGSDTSKLDGIFWRLLSRAPEERERQILLNFIRDARMGLPDTTVLGADFPKATPSDPKEHAVWTFVARTLLNMDAVITRP